MVVDYHERYYISGINNRRRFGHRSPRSPRRNSHSTKRTSSVEYGDTKRGRRKISVTDDDKSPSSTKEDESARDYDDDDNEKVTSKFSFFRG